MFRFEHCTTASVHSPGTNGLAGRGARWRSGSASAVAVSIERVTEVLDSAHGLVVDRVSRIPIGEGTVNFRARSVDGRELFVNVYRQGSI